MYKPEQIKNSSLLDIKNKFRLFFINSSREVLIKKFITVLSAIIFVLILFLPTKAEEVNDISNQYKSVVIVEGKWGKNENEFIELADRLPVGTTGTFESFDIDDNGNVYIIHRGRLHKYNKGSWIKTIKEKSPSNSQDICVNNAGSIFVFFGPWRQYDNKSGFEDDYYDFSGIRIYDQELQLKGTYKLYKKVEGIRFNLFKDENDNIWYEDDKYKYPFYIDGQIYDSSKQIESAEAKEIIFNDTDVKILSKKGKQINFKTNLKNPMERKRFLITDKNNTYLYFADRYYSEFEVHKYNNNGVFEGKIKMLKPDSKHEKASRLINTSLRADKYGNIYQLHYSKEGLKVIKWEKIE
ncbi:MAG: hypothetical protein HY934_08635 [Candidatus Firestonebacteria bacterium]|nr:hypothetical protein [Candidatus Firestonebacteria bacterium]